MNPTHQQALSILAIDGPLRAQLQDALVTAEIIDIFPPNQFGEVFARSRETANASSPYVELHVPSGRVNDVDRIQVSIHSGPQITALLVREDGSWKVSMERIRLLEL